MTDKYFLAGIHHLTQATAEVDYPISKKDLIAQVGSKEVQWDFDEKKTLAELFEPMKVEQFETAAALHNALVATL